MRTRILRALRLAKDRGASAVEYGLMVAAIAAVIVGVVFGLGSVVHDVFNNTCNSVGTATGAGNTDCSID
jgi:pilus assembly protein Flp/PilA